MKLNYCTNCPRWNGENKICKNCGADCELKKVPNKRGGNYFIDEVDHPLPSVTKILQVLAKPGLTYWLKQKVAEAVFANPGISMEDAIKAPDAFKDVAASRGGDIHKIIESAYNGQSINPEDYSDPWKQYVIAYLEFCKTIPHKILKAEHIVYSKKHGYAGQLDCLAEIGGKKVLIDFKTSKGIYDFEYRTQLIAYKMALEEMGEVVDSTAIVHLKPDGTYAFIEMKGEPKDFLACLHLYKTLNT